MGSLPSRERKGESATPQAVCLTQPNGEFLELIGDSAPMLKCSNFSPSKGLGRPLGRVKSPLRVPTRDLVAVAGIRPGSVRPTAGSHSPDKDES